MLRKRGRPSERTSTDQTALLKTALRLFGKSGFEGTNIKTIASEAGVAGSLLYYHYTNKEGLWKAAMFLLGQELHAEMAAAEKLFRDLDPLSFMKAWMRRFVYFSATNPEFHLIITYEMANSSKRADWLLEEILHPLHENFSLKAVQLQNDGTIKKLPLANFFSIAIGATNVFFIQSYQMKKLFNTEVFDNSEIEKHADVVNEIIFNGLLEPVNN